MIAAKRNRFSAAGSALGYLAQVEYALLIALERMDSEESFRLSLETLDDITFEVEGQPRELWQTKHKVSQQGSLGDASPDLWKSIHNWIETSTEVTTAHFFTTAIAGAGTAASLLGISRTSKDVRTAREKLDSVARAAGNASSADYYEKYLSLGEQERTDLLSKTFVLDGAVVAKGITDRLVATVRKATTRDRRLALVDRLRGWWHGRAMDHLTRVARGDADWIDIQDVEDQLLLIAQSLRDENLPLDYENEPQPTQGDVDDDNRIFVEQLQVIMLHHDRIRQAVYDHNRAFSQRSRWLREQLLPLGELDAYDRRLIEAWKRVFLPLEEPSGDKEATADKKCSNARELYAKLQERTPPEIRRDMRSSGYVPLGSLHILADRLEIGWHPDWRDILKHRLAEVRTGEAHGVA